MPAERDTRQSEALANAEPTGVDDDLIVVGIGASAGGQAALEQFFDACPADSGMAFVIVQHMTPTQPSLLAEILAHHTTMPVLEVQDGMRPTADHVHVIPPNHNLAVLGSGFVLMEAESGLRLPIDYFFRSLAQTWRERAVAIVVSGAGGDGSQGIRELKEHGGLVMAQTPASAEHPSMPQSAIDTGLVDVKLEPGQMPSWLMAYIQHPCIATPEATGLTDAGQSDALSRVFALLLEHSGHDFSLYKRNTTVRRIERRIALHRHTSVEEYGRYLEQAPEELKTLFRELLIGVTSFFRDPEAFSTLETTVLPRLFADRRADDEVRVWVAACSTGEEAYSLAMLLCEQRDASTTRPRVQIFATDIDNDAIEQARAGRFEARIEAEMSPERLERWFRRDPHGYEVAERLREIVLFAPQSIIRDPPFSRLDLISCRNVLIYLQPSLQRRVLQTFHYALKPGGILFLGGAENAEEVPHLFRPVDREHRLFERIGDSAARSSSYSSGFGWMGERKRRAPTLDAAPERTLRELVEGTLLTESPACLVVHESGEILFVHGRTGRYLEVPAGKGISSNVFHMAREGLRLPLATVVRKAAAQQERVVYDHVVPRTEDDAPSVRLVAVPAPYPATVLVLFQELATAPSLRSTEPSAPGSDGAGLDARLSEQDRELQAMREYLQATIEELQAANEELRSTNEELQSANEELMTSREELQSVNEELITLNTEHETKIVQLVQIKNDVGNLLTQLDIGIIFLDRKLCVRQFNPAATRISNLIRADIGRPLSHIVSKSNHLDVVADAQRVFDTLRSTSTEVRADDGRRYTMQIQPYRTDEDLIDGVTLTFYDVTARTVVEDVLALEHLALTRTLEVCSRLVAARELPQLFRAVVDGAGEIVDAPMVLLELRDAATGTTRLAAHQGFAPAFEDRFAAATPQRQHPLHAEEPLDEGARSGDTGRAGFLRDAGVEAIQSSRLMSPEGQELGVISTCWTSPHQTRRSTVLLLDLITRVTAALITHLKPHGPHDDPPEPPIDPTDRSPKEPT